MYCSSGSLTFKLNNAPCLCGCGVLAFVIVGIVSEEDVVMVGIQGRLEWSFDSRNVWQDSV